MFTFDYLTLFLSVVIFCFQKVLGKIKRLDKELKKDIGRLPGGKSSQKIYIALRLIFESYYVSLKVRDWGERWKCWKRISFTVIGLLYEFLVYTKKPIIYGLFSSSKLNVFLLNSCYSESVKVHSYVCVISTSVWSSLYTIYAAGEFILQVTLFYLIGVRDKSFDKLLSKNIKLMCKLYNSQKI